MYETPDHSTRMGKLKILDVGCGSGGSRFLTGENVTHIDLSKKAYHLEVVADIWRLPFADDSFDIVHASHILEHIPNTIYVLDELKRVSRRHVIIRVPNAVHNKVSSEDPTHFYSWNESTLRNLLKTCFVDVKVFGYQKIQSFEKHSDLRTLKRLLLSLVLRNDTLTAICRLNGV